MKHAIICLSCGRLDETRQTWEHNFQELPAQGIQILAYFWDNSTDAEDKKQIRKLASKYSGLFVRTYFKQRGKNDGIAAPLNKMTDAAFAMGADAVTTMANDILEPASYLQARTTAIETFPEAGIIAIPIHQQHCQRYAAKEERGIRIEEGHVIGNYTIPRAVWEKGVRFCEDMGIYGPIDLDFCNQVWAANMRCLYLSDLEAIHIGVNNPPDYQKAKDESLAAAWPVYDVRSKEFIKQRQNA